jgi:hypothetical protein
MRDLDILESVLQHGGPAVMWEVDLDKSTVILGSPGLYENLVIAQWR